ncbi:hypothetical protein [Phreatobacter stygius]|uniref:Uncharacterized protein n=1 Tax=Phreatobacter stygius TaxID=1940610 RepID=A0A4D7BH85_9HYPH|nr:hypothetical protein [Phreatobacter stygius]QCI67222.1 hypothetical protein E8M01_25105 [Phreatobacter stygius]
MATKAAPKTTKAKTTTAKTDGQQPESLATFGAAARKGGKKPADVGLVATSETAPIPASLKAKQKAATKVLQRGVTGKDRGADKAAKALPDRTRKGAKGTKGATTR